MAIGQKNTTEEAADSTIYDLQASFLSQDISLPNVKDPELKTTNTVLSKRSRSASLVSLDQMTRYLEHEYQLSTMMKTAVYLSNVCADISQEAYSCIKPSSS